MMASVFRPSMAERITSSCPGRNSSRPNTRFSVRRRGAILVVRATACGRSNHRAAIAGPPVSRRSHESRSDPARSSRARRGACGRTIHFAFMPRRPFPPAVWLLGWVSLLTDAASEAIYPLLPFFLTTVLGGGPVALGIIEGVAEGTNSLLRIVSGRLSDRSRWRRGLVIAGYTLSSAARPFVAVVSAWWQVLVIRFTDRIGKGVRSAPRDALLAFWADPSSRGRVYGFHRAMDHAGAVIGPLLASAFL